MSKTKSNPFAQIAALIPDSIAGFPLTTPTYRTDDRIRQMTVNQEGTLELRYSNNQTTLRQGVVLHMHLKRTDDGRLAHDFSFSLLRCRKIGVNEIETASRILKDIGAFIKAVDAIAKV